MSTGVVRFEDVSATYRGSVAPTLAHVDLEVGEGELCLVVGPTGSGKSTLLGAINGLVPHFTGGHLGGRVVVAGRDTRDHPPRELADVVGVVGQDPLAGFVATTVEDELAYGMEQLAVPPAVMRRRVEDVLDLLGLAHLRSRALRTLSGGQQQRVAIGAVLGVQPRVLVLDEPTSALDPVGAEEVLAALDRLVRDLGVTVVLAEHRLERVAEHADRVVELIGDGTVRAGTPAEVLGRSPLAPPVARLGRWAGWEPVPLSVRDARRAAAGLRVRLAGRSRPRTTPGVVRGRSVGGVDGRQVGDGAAGPVLSARGVAVRYGEVAAVAGVDLDLAAGEVVALMGRNGSGKSSLLWALQGAGRRDAGAVRVGGRDPRAAGPRAARSMVALVPQTPTDLLYLTTVGAELVQADRESGASPGACRGLLDELVAGVPDAAHPRDLSEGQRLALVLALQVLATPSVVLLDEPTRGLDLAAKGDVARVLRRLAGEGRAVLLATHDVELVAGLADRVVVLAEGTVVADGPTAEVVVASPAFAPQVAKVLWPDPWLTVEEVADALAE